LPLVLLAMLFVRVGEQFGLSEVLANLLAPVMEFVGLPPETGIVWALTMLTGIYGGAGAYLSIMPGLELTVAQHSILCSMMLFAHALPVEQAVVHRVGASPWITGAARVVAAIAYGVTANWICVETGFLSERLESPITGIFASNPGWGEWLIDTLLYVFLLIFVVAGLLLLLGVVYGGALMMDEVRSNNYSARSVFTAMLLVSLMHALIEDTLVVLAIGANIWIVLIWRVPFALLFIFLLLRVPAALSAIKPR